jgi:hypothetical protein
MRSITTQPNNIPVPMKIAYEVQIKSLCPPQAYLLLEAHDEDEAAGMTHKFLRNGSSDDFEKALRVLHLPFNDAIACGQYELGDIHLVDAPENDSPVLKQEDIEAIEASVEEMEPIHAAGRRREPVV